MSKNQKNKIYLILLIIAALLLNTIFLSDNALAYSSANIPVRHWSYESIERLVIAGLMSVSGTDTKPMTRVQMACKIKEAVDNIEGENLPPYLALDRDYTEYLQQILYKLINEYRYELVLIGVTSARLKGEDEATFLEKLPVNYNAIFPVETEHRVASVKERDDVLLENENGLRLQRGYNARVRGNSYINFYNHFTVSGRPEFLANDKDTALLWEEAAGKVSWFNLEAAIEKSSMWWGPGFHGSMLLSNNAEPLGLVRIRTVNDFALPGVFKRIGLFGVNFFVSRLEDQRQVPVPKFAGLRIEYAPIPRLTLAANRTSILGGRGRPKLRLSDYWKIFVARTKDEFLTGTSEDKATNTDQLASFDAKFVMPLKPQMRIATGLEAYAEWAGEDKFSFWENESQGYLVGLFLVNILRDKGTDFRVEYARNKPGWYNHGIFNQSGAYTAYTYKNEIIGHHMGGDADDLFLRLSKDIQFLNTPFFDAVKGAGYMDLERHRLTETVTEKKTEVGFDITWAHLDSVSLLLGYEFEYYDNFDLEAGNKARNHIFTAETNIKF